MARKRKRAGASSGASGTGAAGADPLRTGGVSGEIGGAPGEAVRFPPFGRPGPGRLAVVGAALAAGALSFALFARHSRPPNLLLVTIDTLRADHVGAYGAAQARTPHLDALAARGVRFEHASATVPLTGPSHATILTGLYPPQHGVRDNVVFVLDPRHRTLAEMLKDAGYQTAAFVAAYPVAAAFGFRQGFDDFREDFKNSPVPGAGAQRRANDVADDALSWLSTRGKGPFFAWVHFYDPHAPYDAPEPFGREFEGRAYDGEVAFTDHHLGRILAALEAAGHRDDTVVAVVADHGESLGEHGEVTHAVLTYEATLRVPLVLAGPGVPSGVVPRSRVSTVDLLPTLLRLLGQQAAPDLPGRDLGAALRGDSIGDDALYAESIFGRLNCRWSPLRVLYQGDYKLIEGSRSELFDLVRDPSEKHDLGATEPARVDELRRLLRAAIAKLAPGGDRPRTAAIAPEQEALLRSLGYVAGTGGGGSLDEPGLPDARDRVHIYERLQVLQRPQAGLEKALQEAQLLLQEDEGNPFGHQTVASLAYRDGRLGIAARAYRRALELDPDRPAIRQSYGKLLREMGRLEESEKELKVAVEQTDAEDVRTRASLVHTLLLRGQAAEAGKLADALVAKAPKDPEALRARGLWLIAEGRLDEAAPFMAEAAAGIDADPLVEMAEAWLGKGDAVRAQSAAEAALQKTPGQPWATGVLGHALVRQGRREAGLEALRRGVAARPKRPQAWLSLAAGFESARDGASAEACRRAAQALATS